MKNRQDPGQQDEPRVDPLSELTTLRQRLLADEQRLSRALAACPDGVLLADREGRVTHANDAAERLLGTPGRSLNGSNYTDAFWRIVAVNGIPSPEQGPALLQRIQNAEALNGEEVTLERPDGTRVVLGIETAPVFGGGDTLAGTVIRVTEIRGRTPASGPGSVRAGDPIRDVVGSIANDFNNILTAIIGNISLARTEVNHEDEIYRTLTYVEKASLRARDLALRLLSLAAPPGTAAATPPAAAPAPGSVPAPGNVPAEEAIRGTGRILVMDDEEMVRHVASRILTHLGYDVTVATEGAEAVALYTEAMTAGRPFRAVIMDLTVPDGMGGLEAMAELMRIDPGIRAIVSTGYATDPIMTDYRAHGFEGAVSKPYEMTQLSFAVHQVLVEDR